MYLDQYTFPLKLKLHTICFSVPLPCNEVQPRYSSGAYCKITEFEEIIDADYIKTASKIAEFENSIDGINEHFTISGAFAVFRTHRTYIGVKILINEGIKLILKERQKYDQEN